MKKSTFKSFLAAIALACSGGKNIAGPDNTVVPVETPKKLVTAWLQYDWQEGLASLEKNKKFIERVSPAWYHVHPDGSISARTDSPVNDTGLTRIIKGEGIGLYPLIMNVWYNTQIDSLRPVLRSPDLRRKHIDEIVNLVKRNNYDGIDLDYEGLSATDLGFMAQLLDSLYPALKKEGKGLVVSLEVIGTSGLNAWQRIGMNVDDINFLAYGKIRSPGEVLDPNWIRESIQRVITVIPKEKIIQGLPLFGLRWRNGVEERKTWRELTSQSFGAPIIRDPETLTPSYVRGADTVSYEDALSIKMKMEIGYNLGLRKFALWRLGGEDPEIWKVVEEYSKR